MSLPVAILAGGLATRLRPLTENVPKSLIDIAGKPFAVRQFELLRRHGVSDIIFCLGYMGDRIQDILGSGEQWGVKLQYVHDGKILLGTGGALRKALPYLGEAFFVLYGDSYLDCDYAAIEKAFGVAGKLGLMTVLRNDNAWDLSNVVYANGRLVRYDKNNRTPDMNYIDYGLGILQREAFEPYEENTFIDLSVVYQDLLSKGQLAGYEMRERFYEIGSLQGLKAMRRYFDSEK